jgi:NAD(P)-dependent dehydrogenase (short-subunit alcohol dehydrogenase family)
MGRLDNKLALITGAANGIGAAAARLFIAEGAKVALIDRDAATLEALCADIGDQAHAITADVSDSAAIRGAVEDAASRLGGLDIALLNAGIEGTIDSIEEYPEDNFDQVIAVNLRGVFLGLKHTMPALRARGRGSIVITSSIAGFRGRQGMCAYTASKHGVVGLMRVAALEGAPDNIRVNTVHPSPVETRMMRSLEAMIDPNDPERVRQAQLKTSPQGRYAEPEEVAQLMLFLASDDSRHCSGSEFKIDGARSAR